MAPHTLGVFVTEWGVVFQRAVVAVGNLLIWRLCVGKQSLSAVDLTRYCTGVCLQIASHLRISVFSIKPQGHAHKDWRFARREEQEVGPSEDAAPLLEPEQENQTLSSLDSVASVH